MASHQRITLDQLLALCEEILALVRTGVPLEFGLQITAREMPDRVAAKAQSLAARLERGQGLVAALEDEGEVFPPVFRTVVQAGLKSGRLASALEGFYDAASRAAEMRRVVGLSMLYPLFVLALATGMSLAVLGGLADSYLLAGRMHRLADQRLFHSLSSVSWHLSHWLWLVPAGIILAAIVWWQQTGQAMATEPVRFRRLMSWIPGVSTMLRSGRIATFADTRALLVDQHVDLPDALTMAASVSGDREVQIEAGQLAERCVRGEAIPRPDGRRGIPPTIAWILSIQSSDEELGFALRLAASGYRRRAERMADWLRVQLPVVLTVVVGGTATLTYVLAVTLPWYSFVRQIGLQL